MTFLTLKEARWIWGPLLVIWALSLLLYPVFSLPVILALAFTLYFFRDPERVIPSDPKAIVSPADGRVVAVEEVEETEFLHKKMHRISIFLSVFDVHVNRAPIEGTVENSTFKKGAFFDARDPRSSTANQSRTWLFSDGKNQVVVRQITGAIARRIVAWSCVGDKLQKGERFGMIRFGSRTELYLPADTKIIVKVGDRVQGAQSILALFS
jgi:phosphatidylserine decarboxylase